MRALDSIFRSFRVRVDATEVCRLSNTGIETQMKTLSVIAVAALLTAAAPACAQEGHEHSAASEHKHEHAAGPGLFGQPPEYVHVLLNPLPVYGLAIGIVALGIALLVRSKPSRTGALVIVIVSSAAAWPVKHYGQNAYQRVRQISDEQGQQRLDQHMERADKLIYAFYATALLGVVALAGQRKFPKAAVPLAIATLVAGAASFGGGVWISKAGGQIRHPEFRAGSAPSMEAAPNEHGTPDPSHEKMQHEPTQPSDTSGGHKHDATSKQSAEKAPLPDTPEAAWKAIHEHHGELESAVNTKKFNDVQSHAQEIRALAQRLVELSHADHKPVVESGVSKVTHALDELKQSAETGSELVLKNNFEEFAKALNDLEQQMKKQ